MRQPRRRYTRVSWLDQIVYRFQDRWETSSQYRAVVSGVVAAVLLVTMCSCGILGTNVAHAALASIGLGGPSSPSGQVNTGSNGTLGSKSFGIATPGNTPAAPIQQANVPASQTPPPSATATPDATAQPTDTPCPGNSGNCNGGSDKVSISVSPLIWRAGGKATITIQTSQPNIPYSIQMNLPGVSQPVNQTGTTDNSGNFSLVYQIPSTLTAGTGTISITATFPSSYPTDTKQVTCV